MSCPTHFYPVQQSCPDRTKQILNVPWGLLYFLMKTPYWYCFVLLQLRENYSCFHKFGQKWTFCAWIVSDRTCDQWKKYTWCFICFDMKLTCQQENVISTTDTVYQELNTTEKTKKNMCPVWQTDTLIFMVSYEKPNLHDQEVKMLT